MHKMPLDEFEDARTEILPLSVEQYHRMLSVGILEDGAPFELLDGYIVRKDRSALDENPMTVSYEHAWAVIRLARLASRLQRAGCHIRVQLPITLPPRNEPEPDGAIVIGSEDDYAGRHPGPRDVLCVIEIADSSLRRDRTTKLQAYAKNRIPQYVIVNLADRAIELHTQPMPSKQRYDAVTTLGRSDMLSIRTGRDRKLRIPVRQLLP